MVLAADDVGHPHADVVHHHRQVVQRRAVRPQQRQVLDVLGDALLLAVDVVEKTHHGVVGHPEAHHKRPPFRRQPVRLGPGEAPGERVEAPLPALRLLLPALHLELLRRREAAVREPPLEQAERRLPVQRDPLRLHVGALVPVEAEPAETIQDALGHLRRGTLQVGVLDAQDEGSMMLAGKQPAEERGPGATHVQVAGGGGRKAHAYCHANLLHCGVGHQGMAERGGFEPPVQVYPGQLLSRQPCSSTPAPLRTGVAV